MIARIAIPPLLHGLLFLFTLTVPAPAAEFVVQDGESAIANAISRAAEGGHRRAASLGI